MDSNSNNLRAKRKAVALVLVVFVLGIALGALGAYVAGRRVWGAPTEGASHRGKRAHIVERMTRELTLSPDQQKQHGPIFDDMQAKFRALHEQMAPQTEQIRQEGRARIRALLTPEQEPKFEDFLRRFDEQKKKKNEQ